MNPETKLLMDEMHRLFSEQTSQFDKRFNDVELYFEHRISDSELRQEERAANTERPQDVRVQKIEVATNNLQTWRLDTKGLVDDLRLKVTKLNKH